MKLILSIPLITGIVSLCLSPILIPLYFVKIACHDYDSHSCDDYDSDYDSDAYDRSGRDIINRKNHDGFSNC